MAFLEARSRQIDDTVVAADEEIGGPDGATQKQVIGIGEAGPAVDVSPRQPKTNPPLIADKAEHGHPSRHHLDLTARPKMRDRQLMDAAQDFFMQHRPFAMFNRVLIRFASPRWPPRVGFYDASVYASFQFKEHRM